MSAGLLRAPIHLLTAFARRIAQLAHLQGRATSAAYRPEKYYMRGSGPKSKPSKAEAATTSPGVQ